MGATRPDAMSTEEHRAPRLDAKAGSDPALIVAFAESCALTLPASAEPVGRSWFEAQGVGDTQISSVHLSFVRAAGTVTVSDQGSRTDVEAIERMMLHAWPSNVRELDAVLERVAAIDPPPALRLDAVNRVLGAAPLRQSAALTVGRVTEALRASNGNQSQTARELGVTRGQLIRFLKAQRDEEPR
jgi:Bacterial regulatory protein, Fis family